MGCGTSSVAEPPSAKCQPQEAWSDGDHRKLHPTEDVGGRLSVQPTAVERNADDLVDNTKSRKEKIEVFVIREKRHEIRRCGCQKVQINGAGEPRIIPNKEVEGAATGKSARGLVRSSNNEGVIPLITLIPLIPLIPRDDLGTIDQLDVSKEGNNPQNLHMDGDELKIAEIDGGVGGPISERDQNYGNQHSADRGFEDKESEIPQKSIYSITQSSKRYKRAENLVAGTEVTDTSAVETEGAIEKRATTDENNIPNERDRNQITSKEGSNVIGQPVWRHDYDIPFVDLKEGLGVMPGIYKGLDVPVTIEDTFWEGKRKLIPDFDEMRRVDKHAKETPQTVTSNLSKLVWYLIEPAVTDVQRYRSLARWVAENITYDVDILFNGRKDRITSDPHVVLRKRLAVCAGYSALFKAMCDEAGLPCDIIRGQAKGVGYIPGSDKYESHAWNQITIEGARYTCDTTWAAGGIGADQKFVKRWKESEFLSEPDVFNCTRIPTGKDSGVDVRAQLGERPYTSMKEWLYTPNYGSMMQATGASIPENIGISTAFVISHENTGEIRINIPRSVKVNATMAKLPQRTKIDDGCVMISWSGTTAVFRYDLPGPGKYHFSVLGRFASPGDEETGELYGEIISYGIQGKGTQTRSSTHVGDGYCGNSPYAYSIGYQCLNFREPIIETNESRLLFQFACPPWGKAFFRLLKSARKNSTQNAKIENCLYTDTLPGKHVCYVHLPKAGNYLLQHLTTRSRGEDKFYGTTNFVIKFKGKPPAVSSPFPAHNDWGPRQLFHESGLRAPNLEGSTIRLEEGRGVLELERPLSSCGKFLANVVTMQDKPPPKSHGWVEVISEESDGLRRENVFLNIPKPGFYALNLFVDRHFAARFLIATG